MPPTDRINLTLDPTVAPPPADPLAERQVLLQEATNRTLAAGFAQMLRLPQSPIITRSAQLAVGKLFPTTAPQPDRLRSPFDFGGLSDRSVRPPNPTRPEPQTDAGKAAAGIGQVLGTFLTQFKTVAQSLPGGRAVAGFAGAVKGGAETGGAKGAAAAGLGNVLATALGAGISMFTAKLFLFLAPLIALSTILNSVTSGFSLFLQSIQMLGNALGPILFPVMLGLSAAVLALSDYINDELRPKMEEYFRKVMNFFDRLTGGQGADKPAAGGKQEDADLPMRNWVRGPDGNWGPRWKWERNRDHPDGKPELKEQKHHPLAGGPAAHPDKPALPPAPPGVQGQWNMIGGRLQFGGGPGVDPDTGMPVAGNGGPMADFSSRFRKSLDLALREFTVQNRTPAAFSGLVQASKSAQLAALNASPYEEVKRRNMEEMLQAIWRIVDNTGKRPFGP